MVPVFRVAGLVLALALCAAGASAGNNDDDLPILSQQDDASLIRHALRIQAVKKAITKCEARGYLRRPEADAAVQSQSPRAGAVYLAFEKPGLELPAGQFGGPVVIVVTTLTDAGHLRTKVKGSLVIANLEENRLFGADDVAALAETDPSFDPEEPSDAVEVGGDVFSPTVAQVRGFLGCAGWGSLGCMVQAIGTPIPIPQVTVVRILACSTLMTAGCFIYFF